MHDAHQRGERCGPTMQRKYFMFKSDLSCLKTELYFTSSNSVGKPVYPVAQVEVPSLILSDSSLPLSPRASLPQAHWLQVQSISSSDLGLVIFTSASVLRDLSTFLSAYCKGLMIAFYLCPCSCTGSSLYCSDALHLHFCSIMCPSTFPIRMKFRPLPWTL